MSPPQRAAGGDGRRTQQDAFDGVKAILSPLGEDYESQSYYDDESDGDKDHRSMNRLGGGGNGGQWADNGHDDDELENSLSFQPGDTPDNVGKRGTIPRMSKIRGSASPTKAAKAIHKDFQEDDFEFDGPRSGVRQNDI